MNALPADWGSLCALVVLLGMRHGFDADHLAAIDGMTRHNQRRGHAFARYCGALFSAGHGLVVVLVALAVSVAAHRWIAPPWAESLGEWLSVLVLAALGIFNLEAALAARAGEIVAPVGLKSRFFGKLRFAQNPIAVAAVGSLFALSFDTVSQATLFALAARQFGGLGHAMVLALLFSAGMVATDAINGLWISRLIARADQLAAIASRVMSFAVGTVSLLIAALGVARLTMPVIDRWSESRENWLSIVVCLMLAGAYGTSRWLAARAQRWQRSNEAEAV